jgi:hypothetical protein
VLRGRSSLSIAAAKFASTGLALTRVSNIYLHYVLDLWAERSIFRKELWGFGIMPQAAQESFTAMPVATTRLSFTRVSSIRMAPSFW